MKRYAQTALNEAWLILITWCVFCAWVMLSCARHFRTVSDGDSTLFSEGVIPLQTVWGFPDWVFWGIAVPWAVATTLTLVFAIGFLKPEEVPVDTSAGAKEDSDA